MDEPVELVRSTEFWFEDGTIVLQVGTTLYRVYRGFLAARSTVFYDTFSMPQPPGVSADIEGCPIVQLHDNPKDFSRFLRALHQCGTYKTCPVSDFSELSSILRLSDKYDVPLLRGSMISILRDIYPSSLPKWLKRKTPAGYTESWFDDYCVLNLARKMDIRSILPGVMYEVCLTGSESVFSGILAGKTRVKIKDNGDRKRCIVAIPELMVERRQLLRFLLDHDIDGCEDEDECDAERLRWLENDLQDTEKLADEFDPLSEDFEWDEYNVCSACLDAAKADFRAARRRLWNDLPRIFDLPSWNDLLA
ncbi:hypothetical protein B0H10DRAFT_1798863 [Mycena sp. CBHHK59/15]|nr:hypothetical protein B0H10DRAFT_1798863 [Mycena sp. CBHHK59/15]